MSEMVERAARVIARNEHAPGDRKGAPPETNLAREVIEAMREPTNKMICAVLDAHDANPRLTIAEDWRIMIDAALKED